MNAHRALEMVLQELLDGPGAPGTAVVLNTGDAGLLGSLARISAAEASRSVRPADATGAPGATLAAHAEHVRFGLSLLNRWAREGGDPFTGARWDEAWKIATVNEATWTEIRAGLEAEARMWKETLATREAYSTRDLLWAIGSVAHLAYHLGAMRQIVPSVRGPKDPTAAGAESSSAA
jgi:hypothetical protein